MTRTEFVNPTGGWSYEGRFWALVTTNATLTGPKSYEGVQVEGTFIRVGYDKRFPGHIAQGMGAIQLQAGIDQPFFFDYKHLIRLCKPNGHLIWENHDLKHVLMQEVKERPSGAWPMFYYDGERVLGQIGTSGPWWQLSPGQEVRFRRHGTFRFRKAFKTLVYLDVTLPRSGWNPKRASQRIRIPTGKCLTVFRSNYHLEWMNSTRLYNGFGYQPGHEPLRDSEVNAMLELLQPGPLMEERARAAMAAADPHIIRHQLRSLRLAANRAIGLRARVEEIKAEILAAK